jgi:hypothetical protein
MNLPPPDRSLFDQTAYVQQRAMYVVLVAADPMRRMPDKRYTSPNEIVACYAADVACIYNGCTDLDGVLLAGLTPTRVGQLAVQALLDVLGSERVGPEEAAAIVALRESLYAAMQPPIEIAFRRELRAS